MNYSSNLPRQLGLTQDLGFTLILAFDYYDGPEKGLALFGNGEGVRFSSLGESRSRLFRSFELMPIAGNWGQRVNLIQEAELGRQSRVLFPQSRKDEVSELEHDVFNAQVLGHYVGIGSLDFECLSVARVPGAYLEILRRRGCSPEGFNLVHRILKKKFSTRHD